jgi:hypothetical protein
VPSVYNGRPLFAVNLSDFTTVTECVHSNKRLLARNIQSDELREYFVNTRKPFFAVTYEDVIVSYGRS